MMIKVYEQVEKVFEEAKEPDNEIPPWFLVFQRVLKNSYRVYAAELAKAVYLELGKQLSEFVYSAYYAQQTVFHVQSK